MSIPRGGRPIKVVRALEIPGPFFDIRKFPENVLDGQTTENSSLFESVLKPRKLTSSSNYGLCESRRFSFAVFLEPPILPWG